jgi:hypothetical protein
VTAFPRTFGAFPPFGGYPPFYPQPFYPQPYPYPAPAPAPVAPQTFTFEVTAQQVAQSDSKTFNTWAEAMAHAQQLFQQTPGAVRVVIRDQSGAQRIFPSAPGYAAPGAPLYPPYGAPGYPPYGVPYPGYGYPYGSPFGFRRGIFPFGGLSPFGFGGFGISPVSISRSVALAGPFAGLSNGPSTLGQFLSPTLIDDAQWILTERRGDVVSSLAQLYRADGFPEAAITTPEEEVLRTTAGVERFTLYTDAGYLEAFPGADLAPVPRGLPLAPAGTVIIINHLDHGRALTGEQNFVRVAYVGSIETARQVARAGSQWAVLGYAEAAPEVAPPLREPAPPTPAVAARPGISPAVIAAGVAAAAVAALLLFT